MNLRKTKTVFSLIVDPGFYIFEVKVKLKLGVRRDQGEGTGEGR